MLSGFVVDGGRLRAIDDPLARIDELVWLDLLEPSSSEEAALETALSIDIPTREEMEEIEISSRLYKEDGAVFMTAALPARTDSDDVLMGAVTFVLVNEKLVTVRYHEPRAFKTFPQRAAKTAVGCTNGTSVTIALLEATVDRLADIVERVQKDVQQISREIFKAEGAPTGQKKSLHGVLQLIGRKGEVNDNLRDSLASLQRLTGFFAQTVAQQSADKELRGRVRTLSRDVQSLTDQSTFLAEKVSFLLDATLGVITIEQSNIIKIFSIAAGVFLPPTLIASIYGMNFRHMPELGWVWGYPLAGLLMLLSGALPYWFFKRRGWL
jgi:magnesium transporter